MALTEKINAELASFTFYNAAKNGLVSAAQKADASITGLEQTILPFLSAVETSINNKGNDVTFSIG